MNNTSDIRNNGIATLGAIAAIMLGLTAQAVNTNEFYVAAGETKSVSDIVAEKGYTFADGDILRKTGPGQLNAVNNTTTKINLWIEEGVYYVANGIHQKGNTATLIVKDGATVNCAGNTIEAFQDYWNVYLEGSGVGTGDNLGALCIGGCMTNPTFGTNSKFILNGDATIYSYGTMNAVFSGTSSTSGPTLDMQSKTLTIRGKDGSAVFRPRWKWTIKNSGTIIVQNGEFARHNTTNSFSPDIPLVKVIENGKLAAYSDGAIWSKVAAFDFEYGSSLYKGNGSPSTATLTMKKVTGSATVSDTLLTISQEFAVRGTDLVAEHHLTSAKQLTFADGCKLSVIEWGTLSLAPGTRYVVAESSVGITGTPTLAGTAAGMFTIANEGKQLILVAKDANKLAGLQPGEENAAANTALIGEVVVEDNDVLCFPNGDYYFSDAIDFSSANAKNVSIYCLETNSSVLHAGIKLGAMENVKVSNLKFKGLATPAVIANGTAGLTIESCTLEQVKGTYGELGNFPYALVNVADFEVSNATYVPDAAKAESTEWDGQAYFNGGSQTTNSWARAGEVVVYAYSSKSDNWMWLSDLTNSLHLTKGAYANKTLRKIGPSTLDVTSSINLIALKVTGVEIQKEQYVARTSDSLGVQYYPAHVHPGASLAIYGSVVGPQITFSGDGLGGGNRAVRFTGDAAWNKTEYVRYTLEGDASMYNNCSGENGTFFRSAVHMNEHTLTLVGIAASNYRIGRYCKWNGGGTVIVDGVSLSSASGDSATSYRVESGDYPSFRFINSAKFVPDDATICNLIRNVDFANGTRIGMKNNITGFAISFDSMIGNPEVDTSFTGLTINKQYSARLSDFTAGKIFKLSSGTPLTFASGSKLSIIADELGAPTQDYAIVSATGGITGKPKLDDAANAAGWGVSISADRKTLYVGPKRGLNILLK